MKLLLISNSTNAGEAYLKYPIAHIGAHLQGVSEVIKKMHLEPIQDAFFCRREYYIII